MEIQPEKPKRIVLVIVLLIVIFAIWRLEAQKNPPSTAPVVPLTSNIESSEPASPSGTATSTAQQVKQAASQADIIKKKSEEYQPAVEFVSPSGFINTDKFALKDIAHKKVILVSFWTYSCINCIREIPYLKAWYQKYKDQGLEIVGVHTPEFEFEHDYNNVSAAVKKFGIEYPVVQDNDMGTWNAYNNRFWPHVYLIDIDGFIVYDHIGEGNYDETERQIQAALKERAEVLKVNISIRSEIVKVNEGGDLSKIGSRETYFGASRNEFLTNGVPGQVGEKTFVAPGDAKLNALYLDGRWGINSEFAENKSENAKIIFRYASKGVYLVGSADAPTEIKILRDGNPLGNAAGDDVLKTTSSATIHENRLYKLIDDPAGYGEHTIEIIIPKPGLKAFTFTFG